MAINELKNEVPDLKVFKNKDLIGMFKGLFQVDRLDRELEELLASEPQLN